MIRPYLHPAYFHALDIKEIVGAIHGLTTILDGDTCRDANDGEKAVLGDFERGAINLAIKQLALRVEELAEFIEEDEERQAEQAEQKAQRNKREGKS